MAEETHDQLQERIEALNSIVAKSFTAQGNAYPLFTNLLDSVLLKADASPLRTAGGAISNAQLMTLDTQYLEIVPAPANGNYLEIEHIGIGKHGEDVATIIYEPTFRVALSPDNILTLAEAEAGNSHTGPFVTVPDWPDNTPQYVFAGIPTTENDLTGFSFRGEDNSEGFIRVFEAYNQTLEVDGIPFKWWRTRVAHDDAESVTGRSYLSGWYSANTSSLADIARDVYIATFFEDIDAAAADKPLFLRGGRELIWVAGNTISEVINSAQASIFAEKVGGHGLIANKPLLLGCVANYSRAERLTYSPDAFDSYVAGAADVSLTILVRYRVHDLSSVLYSP